MADLSRVTGVSVPMIKFYLREGLLPSGERTSPNQARYGQEHVRRIMLVRAMADYAGLSIADIRDLLGHLDDPRHSLHDRLGHAQKTITPRREPGEGEEWAAATRGAEELIARHGWLHDSDSPAMRTLAGVLLTLEGLGYRGILDRLDEYAEAAARIAEADVASMAEEPNLERMVEVVVVGTSLGDALVAALRRVAQANVSARLLGEVLRDPACEEPGPGGPS
ncbi:MerR family transcriptional regulator [Streptosporangium sp. NPDC051022]|uniref:MerR family transcriptional regulator n=1 Tax=Streptosporangium sp. NPDC051022 TaxID=3155752 RepID=UPI003422EDE9